MSDDRRRVILVTGASRGLGREMALRFGKAGERVAVNFRDREDDARSSAEQVRNAGGDALVLRADVSDAAAVRKLVAEVLDAWGRIDVLVNNAGIARDGFALRMTEENWDAVLRTDLSGPFYCIRAAAETMVRQRSGHIISIGSITGMQGRPGQANYSAAKAGLIGMTRAAAVELGRHDIKVNAVLPGYLATHLGETLSAEYRETLLGTNVLGRSTDAAEVAEFIYRLSLMRNVSGQVFNLDSRIL